GTGLPQIDHRAVFADAHPGDLDHVRVGHRLPAVVADVGLERVAVDLEAALFRRVGGGVIVVLGIRILHVVAGRGGGKGRGGAGHAGAVQGEGHRAVLVVGEGAAVVRGIRYPSLVDRVLPVAGSPQVASDQVGRRPQVLGEPGL